MTGTERGDWQALQASIAALRHANLEARVDVPGSGYDISATLDRLNVKSRRLHDCEIQIAKLLESSFLFTWFVRRWFLGKLCREVFDWYDRRTDDNFGWTKQAFAIRTSRDEVSRLLKQLGF